MPSNRTVQELLRDANFRSLLSETSDRSITWDEFLSRPQPQDMSPLVTWGLLTDIHRCTGMELLPRDFEGTEFWYKRTSEISDLSCALTRSCHGGSRIHTIVSSSSGQHFLVKSRISETVAAAQLDGLAIPQEDARALLRMGRTPQNSTEQLVANVFRALEGLGDLVDQPFSVELFVHLGESLLKNVSIDSLKLEPARIGTLVGVARYTDEQCKRMAQRQLEDTARYLNQEISGPYDPPAVQGLLMSDAFSLYRPLGLVSTQVGRLAARLHAMKSDLPVLGLLPISEAKLAWEEGLIQPPDVTFTVETLEALRRRNLENLTPHQTLNAQLALYTLRELEQNVGRWERRDSEMRDILHNDPLLNQRQRSILARAIRSPEAEFSIRYHKTNHRVAYTTARRDLLELMEKQYLIMEQRGKAFVFLRGPRLDELEATVGHPTV